jgi:septal ring factor EnvC (AmiA/AmiB activator)
MKNLFTLLVFLIIGCLGTSQNLNESYSSEQDLVKITQENEALKKEILVLKKEKAKVEKQLKNESLIKLDLIAQLKESERLLTSQKVGLSFSDQPFSILGDKDKDNEIPNFRSNRFGFGVSVGTTLDRELNLKPYLGVGFTFNLVVF